MENRTLRPSDYRVLSNFRYEIRRFLNFSEQAARHAGIEPHQHQALLAIRGLRSSQKPSVGVLAERLQIEHHSAVELVNRLERKHLIRRSRNAMDRRQVLLQLTGRGDRILRRLTRAHRADLKTTGPKLLRALNAVLSESSRVRDRKGGNSIR